MAFFIRVFFLGPVFFLLLLLLNVIDWLVKSGFQQAATADQGADGMHVVQQKHNVQQEEDLLHNHKQQ